MANKIYIHEEAEIEFKASGGDVTFTPQNLAAGNGRQSSRHDLGTAARSRLYAWRAYTKCSDILNEGELIRIYLKTSDGTHEDNNDGTSDAAVSHEDKLRNLDYIGGVAWDEWATVPYGASGLIELNHRYVQVVWWNGSNDDTLTNVAADHGFILTPVPPEVQ